ncbi:hypothetical protein Ahia01_001053500 [Argonauta hians]
MIVNKLPLLSRRRVSLQSESEYDSLPSEISRNKQRKDIIINNNSSIHVPHFPVNLSLEFPVQVCSPAEHDLEIAPHPLARYWYKEKSLSKVKIGNKTPASVAEPRLRISQYNNSKIKNLKDLKSIKKNDLKTNNNTSSSPNFKLPTPQTVLTNPGILNSPIGGFMPNENRLKKTMGYIFQKKCKEGQKHLKVTSYQEWLLKAYYHASVRDRKTYSDGLNTKGSVSGTVQQCLRGQSLHKSDDSYCFQTHNDRNEAGKIGRTAGTANLSMQRVRKAMSSSMVF